MSCDIRIQFPASPKRQRSILRRHAPYFGGRKQEIEEGLAQCSEAQKVCMKFLYGTMPISDIANYDFSLFLKYVDHALFLRENVAMVQDNPRGHLPQSCALLPRQHRRHRRLSPRTFYEMCWPRLVDDQQDFQHEGGRTGAQLLVL